MQKGTHSSKPYKSSESDIVASIGIAIDKASKVIATPKIASTNASKCLVAIKKVAPFADIKIIVVKTAI